MQVQLRGRGSNDLDHGRQCSSQGGQFVIYNQVLVLWSQPWTISIDVSSAHLYSRNWVGPAALGGMQNHKFATTHDRWGPAEQVRQSSLLTLQSHIVDGTRSVLSNPSVGCRPGGSHTQLESVSCGAVTTMTALQLCWSQLLQAAQIPAPSGATAFDELCHAYQEEHRHYHTLVHIEHMLGLVYDSGNAQPAALWATWYHDFIYRPGWSDNEARSAEHARQVLTRLQVAEPIIERCEHIILATRSHTFAGSDAELQGVLDADMAILGAPPQRYLEYCAEVRREFALIPEPAFRRGRRDFLEQVLAQSRIFATEWFWQRFEAQARDNLKNELARM